MTPPAGPGWSPAATGCRCPPREGHQLVHAPGWVAPCRTAGTHETAMPVTTCGAGPRARSTLGARQPAVGTRAPDPAPSPDPGHDENGLDAYVKSVADALSPLISEQRDLLALIYRQRRRTLSPRTPVRERPRRPAMTDGANTNWAGRTTSAPTENSLLGWRRCTRRGCRHAGDNRAFVGRAVTWAAGQGIGQFLDLGAGLPTRPAVHEAARRSSPWAATTTRGCGCRSGRSTPPRCCTTTTGTRHCRSSAGWTCAERVVSELLSRCGRQGGGGAEGDPLPHVGPEPASGRLDRDGEQGLEHRALRAQGQPVPGGGHVGGSDQRGERGDLGGLGELFLDAGYLGATALCLGQELGPSSERTASAPLTAD